MKAATIRELKLEMTNLSSQELMDLCLRLSRFKKENKELLTYLLFEATNEAVYIENIKAEVDEQFEQINTTSYYFIKKSVRKILRMIKKYIRYSQNKETEVELLIYFCFKLIQFKPTIKNNVTLQNLLARQVQLIKKTILSLHEDLQYDYNLELDSLLK